MNGSTTEHKKIRIGIIGGAGYTGGELLRILVHHPNADIVFVNSRSNAGKPVQSIHQDLLGDTVLKFSAELDSTVDLLFLCLGHGESKKFLAENELPAAIRIIDLANDFRLSADATTGGREFIYGLPELNRDKLINAKNVANPGCFATAIQLGLLPLAKEGLLRDVYTTGITGSTGAGQSLSATSHFSWRANNIQAYKTLTHQHLGEIGESLTSLQTEGTIDLSFVPWRGDFTRGIFVSSTLPCDLAIEELNVIFDQFYKDAAFTHVSREPIFLKQVVNSNKGMVQIEKAGSKIVVHSVIDNLLKGASGHAVQNMNLMFGLKETTGLLLKANYF
jgi:N-acetyl-gamma-glutamyl-phosphate reductase